MIEINTNNIEITHRVKIEQGVKSAFLQFTYYGLLSFVLRIINGNLPKNSLSSGGGSTQQRTRCMDWLTEFINLNLLVWLRNFSLALRLLK